MEDRPYFTLQYRDWTLRVFDAYSTVHCPQGCELSPDMVGCPWHWKRTPERVRREERWQREVLQRRKDKGMLFPVCNCKNPGAMDETGRCVCCGGLHPVTRSTR